MSTELIIVPKTKAEQVEELKLQIELLKLELMKLECRFKIGEPLCVFDKWYRLGTLKGFMIMPICQQASIVLQLYTRDKVPYDYYCYDVHQLKDIKVIYQKK